jgi:hypothetical protein
MTLADSGVAQDQGFDLPLPGRDRPDPLQFVGRKGFRRLAVTASPPA